MSCNCNPITPCNSCQKGVPCNCSPVYPVPNSTVPCQCCPNGYAYSAPTVTNPNGLCTVLPNFVSYLGKTTAPIACVQCKSAVPTDCVTYTGIIPIQCGTVPNNIYGITAGDTLTTIISKMCITNENVLEAMLTAIGNSSRALAGFCHLVQNCGSIPGVTTPILGPITWTIP